MKLDDTKDYIKQFERECKEVQFPIYMARLEMFFKKYFDPEYPKIFVLEKVNKIRIRSKAGYDFSTKKNTYLSTYDVYRYLLKEYREDRQYQMVNDRDLSNLGKFLTNILDVYGIKKVIENLPIKFNPVLPKNFKPLD